MPQEFEPSFDPKGAPIICVGLSAGGLAPLKTIFQRLSPATGMAFVVINHLSSAQPTWLPSLLSGWSQMPVHFAENDVILKPNHIYVIPPGQEITTCDGYLGSRPRSKLRGWSNVLTLFLQSLVKFRKPPGIAVILSGMDSDGAAALEAFHKRGLITIAQDLTSAEHKDMPRSGIKSGFVDYVLPPEAIPGKLEEIAKSSQGRNGDLQSEEP